ncbi:MAG: hypothetical protein WB643_10430 [Candidatus Bathyarchaeia archaeon]
MKEIQERLLRCAMGFSLGLGLLVLLNQLQIPYYLYYPRTTQTALISSSYDLYIFLIASASAPLTLAFLSKSVSISSKIGLTAIWAVSLALTITGQPLAIVILYLSVICATMLNLLSGHLNRSALGEILPSTLIVFILVEFSSLFYWPTAALNPLGRFGVQSEQLEGNLTFALYPLAFVMLLLLLFSWLWIPLVRRLPPLRKHILVRYQPTTSKWSWRPIAASLDLFAIISIIIFFYAYLAGQGWVVGVDSHLRYLDPLNALLSLPPSQALSASYTHGAYLLALYLIERATNIGSFTLVKYAPLIFAFATASAAFFATLKGGWNLELSLIASVSVLLWLPTTLGIYAGLQANWVALLTWMLFLTTYFAKGEWTMRNYIVSGLLSHVIFVVHPWTWGVFIATLLLTTLIAWRSGLRKRCLHGLLAALIIPIPVAIAAYALLPSLGQDLGMTIQLYSLTALNPSSLVTFGSAMLELFYNWGSFLSPAILLLSLLGAYSLSRRRGLVANYLLAWIAAWCVGSILIAPVGYNPVNVGISETGLWRMLYVSPLPFLLGLGVAKGVEFSKYLEAGIRSEAVSARVLQSFMFAPYAALGVGLFVFWDPATRFLIVTFALILVLLLTNRLPRYYSVSALVGVFLVLLILNAAFRSLFPLLLDPHNLFSATGTR